MKGNLIKTAKKVLPAIVISLLLCSGAIACLWDNDTLAMEQREFPSVLELITGKFLRHSPKFYAWRVKDRQQRLKTESKPELYDDLAVAHDKLGQHEKAIALMEQKEKLFPGKYETRANLGTFYIHSGQLERGVKEIEAAIEINPDAHFGREVYQLLLVKYLLSKQVDGEAKLPLESKSEGRAFYPSGFAKYVLEQAEKIREAEDTDAKSQSPSNNSSIRKKIGISWQEQELQLATKGVLGMMRFGNFDSPILLEALGDLLSKEGAKQLAARAYLKASYEVEDEVTQTAYRANAEDSLQMQTISPSNSDELSLAALEKEFLEELAQAKDWHAQVTADENKWIFQNVDADAAFAKKYYQEPKVEVTESEAVQQHHALRRKQWTIVIGTIVSVLLLIFGMTYWCYRKTSPKLITD